MRPGAYLCLLLAIGLFCGCSKSTETETKTEAVQKHEHHPPHGGTPVVLGDEEYHVELVLDAAAGKLQAFVFDGELENFIRIPAASIEIDAQAGGREEPLILRAVANSATGEKVGDTSLFETQADWLKTTTNFDATLKEIVVRGKAYSNVKFNFPKGNDADEKSQGSHSGPQAEVHGELIQTSALAVSNVGSEMPTNEPPHRKHPQPPSVQRRMVMAQLAPPDQTGASGAGMPSGTLGTAADLAKTNLVSAASLPPISEQRFGCPEVSFRMLSSFDLQLNHELANGTAGSNQTVAEVSAQIPSEVRALDGKRTVIQGFLLPVKMDDGLAVEFLLMRNQSMCCYGVPPKINEWITVQMTGKGVKPVMDQPVVVVGTLHVGPMQENGLLTGIYSLDGEKVIGP
jgi:hypothetical protein